MQNAVAKPLVKSSYKQMRQKEYKENLLPLAKEIYPMACRLLNDDTQAEDLMQEVMLSLWDKRHKLHITTSYKVFLYKTVKNRCFDELKKRKTIAQQVESIQEPSIYPKEDFDTMQWIKNCIEKLPEQQKQIVYMREVDGLEFFEIAQLLNLKEPNVRMILSRAKKTLRAMIKTEYNYG